MLWQIFLKILRGQFQASDIFARAYVLLHRQAKSVGKDLSIILGTTLEDDVSFQWRHT